MSISARCDFESMKENCHLKLSLRQLVIWYFNTWICLRFIFCFLHWEITTKPPCGRIFLSFSKHLKQIQELGYCFVINTWLWDYTDYTFTFLFFHFKLLVVHCRSVAMVKRLPKDLEAWKWVQGSNDRLQTVGCGYAWCVEDSNWKQQATNTIFLTPSHLRMEGPEWNL